ncbi:MAG: response regulator transcription factor [Bacteroidales bacterium]|nr:response regulator transcription factor [Bacteroidales bacterium]
MEQQENVTKIDVVIVDDHRMVVEGIARTIDASDTAQVVAVASSIKRGLACVRSKRPDVLLLDVALPDGDGIEAIASMLKVSPQTRVIVFTSYSEPAVIQRAMEAHAHGFLLKSANSADLLKAIGAVLTGTGFFCDRRLSSMVNRTEVHPVLTHREREVLRLIVEGKSIKEIANELCLGFETVHSYTKYLRRKFKCHSSTALVRIAMERHLV